MPNILAASCAVALAVASSISVGLAQSEPVARRLEVLFFGAPTKNHPGHDPVVRYRVLKKHLGDDGITLTYQEVPAEALSRGNLARFDAVVMYGNWHQRGKMPKVQEDALVEFVEKGGGFLPIHCASACYNGSPRFVSLVGGVFRSHGGGVFAPRVVRRGHPIMRGYRGFEAWDETYVHAQHGTDRTILQERDGEPWTWVRTQGRGRVFYTASGHDLRVWNLPEFHDLLLRAIRWAAGDAARARLAALELPKLETMAVQLPGYRERKLIEKIQKPLSPVESMKLAQVPPGFELQLFAAEPDIINPICVQWDAAGRAYVVETVDYPNNLQMGEIGNDRIKICEDTDGDGRADRFTVFADKLSIPTTLVCSNGGVVCTNGSQVLFLRDTDGDLRADERRVLFDGIGTGDTHAGTSNFRYGFDNWIWATSGYSGFQGEVGGKQHRFGSGVFRFRPDGSAIEFLQNTTNNTWGLGFSEEFDVHGSTANANPSWYLSFSRRHYVRAGVAQPRTPRADDNPEFFPSSTDIRQVDAFDRYTAGAGHAFYTARRFPKEYWNRIAFVCAPTGKLVGQFARRAKGAGFELRQLPNNLDSSADAWSGPVCAEVGPDVAVWICDWYNMIIQHNPTPSVRSSGLAAKRGKGNAYVTPHRDKQHGRIYRVFPKGTPNDVGVDFSADAFPAAVEKGLGHDNLFWRLTAQRVAVERGVAVGKAADLHRFYALLGQGALDLETIKAALAAEDVGLRRAALRNAPLDETLIELFVADGKIRALDARTTVELFLALSRISPSEVVGAALATWLETNGAAMQKDPVLPDAFQVAVGTHALGFLKAAIPRESLQPKGPVDVLRNGSFAEVSEGRPVGWVERKYGGGQQARFRRSNSGRNGSAGLLIESATRADVGWGARVRVRPRHRYRLGGWIKVEDVKNVGGRGVMFNVHGIHARTRGISGTHDWREYSVEFKTGGESEILIHCLFGGYGGSTGKAWFDDVYLLELDGSDVSGMVRSVANRFAQRGAALDRAALQRFLQPRASEPMVARILQKLHAPREVEGPKARRHPVDPAVHRRGALVYRRTCIACHGPRGIGVAGAFPPLDGSGWATGESSIPIKILLHGLIGPIEVKGTKFNGAMPPHVDLNDQEIADVLTFVRQSWSNDAVPVAVKSVADVRAQTKDKKGFWTAAELRK